MTSIILQRFANREYRLTHQTILDRKPSGGDKYEEVQSEKYANAVANTYVLSQNLIEGECASIEKGKLKRHEFGEVDARLGIRSLDIINEFRQITAPKKKGGWGSLSRPTSFTRNAKHRLLESGAIVDKDCGKDAWEVTLTLPGSTPEAVRACAEHSGWLIDRLLREVRREKCLHWFYVWEFQKKGKLHLHFLVAGKKENTKTIAHCLEYQWWELLWELSQNLGIDMFAKNDRKTWKYEPSVWQSHTAQVYRSVAAYFSKYASKPSCKKSKGFTIYQKYSPSRWWGCSSHLKDRIRQTRRRYSLSVSKQVAKKIEDYLQIWLSDPGRVKAYNYQFQLGQTANGTELGGGEVWVNYYEDAAFSRLQSWEDIMWSGAIAIAHECGEYDYPEENWNHQDHACPSPLDAAIAMYKSQHKSVELQTHTPPQTPLNQQSSNRRKLSKSRGLQPEATLELRARLVQFLAGGVGGILTKKPEPDLIPQIPGLTKLLTGY